MLDLIRKHSTDFIEQLTFKNRNWDYIYDNKKLEISIFFDNSQEEIYDDSLMLRYFHYVKNRLKLLGFNGLKVHVLFRKFERPSGFYYAEVFPDNKYLYDDIRNLSSANDDETRQLIIKEDFERIKTRRIVSPLMYRWLYYWPELNYDENFDKKIVLK